MGSSYTPGFSSSPLMQNRRVPPFLGVPRLANHSPPPRMMCGTLAKVSALLITVGPPHRPTTAGKGGRMRGMPRIRPPFPAVVGLWGGPTVINNAETLASVPHIILGGGEWFANLGTPRNGGTRLFCMSGELERPGVYELPMGYNLKKMIYEVSGGMTRGKNLKGVVPGGSSVQILTPDEIDVAMDFDSMMKAGSMLGSGGVIVLDDQMCIVRFALRVAKFYQHESCGWCIPCREGTDWMKKTLTRFHAGGGVAKDIDNLKYLAENMLGRTFCPLGDAAAMPIISYIQKFRKEFEDHLDGKPCPYEKAAEPALV